MKISDLTAYEIVENRTIDDLNSEGYVLRHKKTGAKIALLSNDDENKVFSISFRTPPEDSTGVPHIVEHTVLCGSKEFPVKDPFIELAKGSLNTFLNAMTFPDKTMYPVASCNDKDFQNLMHVYLDAVFYPNIYREEKIFRQEGWHYEMETPDSPLEINGVVYSEMKGAFSNPEDVVERQIQNALFPDVVYGVESGGDPDVIPELTYEGFLDFHRRYYHPSNSYIYLYGNMDMAEKLTFIDEHYLSKFDYQPVDSEIKIQKPFDAPKDIRIEYPIADGEEEEDNTFLTYNVIMGESVDRELYVALQVLDYAICSAPGAPLRTALIDKGIGKDVYSSYENGIRQPGFSILARNANEDQKEEFLATIREVLTDLAENGFNKKSLLAALTYFEFKYREADFGSYPKGLMYGIQIMDSWLYDDKLAFWHIEQNATFAALKEKVESGYFEDLIKKYLLNNNHCAVVVAVPKKGLTSEKEEALKAKLQAYKDTLSAEEVQKIVDDTKALKEYQESEDSPEMLAKIPLLSREDISPEPYKATYTEEEIDNQPYIRSDIFTNGIGYLGLFFTIKDVPLETLKYVSLLRRCLGYMDTSKRSYGDLFDETSLYTGGIGFSFAGHRRVGKDEDDYYFSVMTKVLYENMDRGFELMEETIFDTIFEDEKRLKEIVSETKSRMQSSFISSGHAIAAARAASYHSKKQALMQQLDGLEYYRLLEKIETDFETEGKEAIRQMKLLLHYIFRKENMIVNYISPTDKEFNFRENVKKLTKRFYEDELPYKAWDVIPEKKNEAFKTSAQIQYVCRAGNFMDKGLKYTSRLKVLKTILGYDYLWMNVRVKGGAYGCMSGFSRFGECHFVSYRDPNLAKTNEIFEGVVDYLENFDVDERTMTQFIIGTISNEDIPLSNSAKGTRAFATYLTGITYDILKKERQDILSTTPEDIQKLAEYMKAFLSDDCICVVGGENAIEEAKDLFKVVTTLSEKM